MARFQRPAHSDQADPDNTSPGITRQRAGSGWSYRGPDGKLIRDPRELARIRSLAVPPAYRDVWLSPDPRAPLQAVGRDAKGRKQYRYHPEFRSGREAQKFGRLTAFLKALPTLRARLGRDLAKPGLPRDKVIATIVRLMETTLIRIGNVEYARANGSYGLTTLLNRHVRIGEGSVRLNFRAKSGIQRSVEVTDPELVQLVCEIRALRGRNLFQYIGDDDKPHTISSKDVNDYLRRVTGEEVSAKDFRTSAATWLALGLLTAPTAEAGKTITARKRILRQAIGEVAEQLGNTPAICRKSYIHPTVQEAYLAGSLGRAFRCKTAPPRAKRRSPNLPASAPQEAAIIGFLESAG